MNARIRFFSLLLLFAGMVGVSSTRGQVVGYVNGIFPVGASLFGNPLNQASNVLSVEFPTAPAGATISLWDPATERYNLRSKYSSGQWSLDLTLAPGQGALLTTPLGFTNTFVGTVLGPDGLPWYFNAHVAPPPAFTGPPGDYLLSSKFPALLSADTGYNPFLYIIGRSPRDGEQITTLDRAAQTYFTTTFSAGVWDNGEPSLAVGEAAFFHLVPVPEPGCGALALLAGAGLAWVGRRSY